MAKVVMLELPGGVVGVIVPVGDVRAGESESDYLDRVAAQALANDAATPNPLLTGAIRRPNTDVANLPSGRWRAAWRWVNGVLAPDIAAARLIRKAEVLALRDARLGRVRIRRAAAEEDGQTLIVTALKQRAATLRGLDGAIDTQLANVSDLATLDTWTPSEFSGTPD